MTCDDLPSILVIMVLNLSTLPIYRQQLLQRFFFFIFKTSIVIYRYLYLCILTSDLSAFQKKNWGKTKSHFGDNDNLLVHFLIYRRPNEVKLLAFYLFAYCLLLFFVQFCFGVNICISQNLYIEDIINPLSILVANNFPKMSLDFHDYCL